MIIGNKHIGFDDDGFHVAFSNWAFRIGRDNTRCGEPWGFSIKQFYTGPVVEDHVWDLSRRCYVPVRFPNEARFGAKPVKRCVEAYF